MSYTTMDGSMTWGYDSQKVIKLRLILLRSKCVYKQISGGALERYSFTRPDQIDSFIEQVDQFLFYQSTLIFKNTFGEIFRTNKTGFKKIVEV